MTGGYGVAFHFHWHLADSGPKLFLYVSKEE